MESPLISIIIPVYNVEPYLRQCLDSILNQSCNDWEAILVDDGSTDGSGTICDEYASHNSRIKVFHKENGGVSTARNTGLNIANGEWIWFVDGDDWIEKNAISILYNCIVQNTSTDIIYFGLNQVGENKIWKSSATDILNMSKENFLRSVQCNTHQAILYKHSIIKSHNIFFSVGMKMAEDLEYQYKYLLHCKNPIQISPTLYFLREREGSASHNQQTTRNSLYGNQMILSHMLDYIKRQNDKGIEWMGSRLVARVKNLMKASFRLNSNEIGDVQSLVRMYIYEFRTIGYPEFSSLEMHIYEYNIQFYKWAHNVLLNVNKVKKKLSQYFG